jgi:gliding motility-associated-like protein
MLKTSIAVLFLLMAGILPLSAQECEWLNTSNASGHQWGYQNAVDDSSNVIFTGTYHGPFALGGFTFSTSQNPFILKYDKDGNLKSAWEPVYTTGAVMHIESVETDDLSNVYIAGHYKGDINLGGGRSLSGPPSQIYKYFAIKFNPQLQAQWALDFGHKTNFISQSYVELGIDDQENVLVGFHYHHSSGFTGVPDSVFNTNPARQNVGLVKYNSNGVFQWARGYGGSSEETLSDLDCDNAGNVFMLMKSDSTLTIGTALLHGDGETIIKVSPSGGTLLGIKNPSTSTNVYEEMRPWGIAVGENGGVAVTGNFSDTAFFQGVPLYSTGLRGNSGYTRYNNYVAYYSNNLQLKWVKKDDPDSVSCTTIPGGRISIKNNFIYFGGTIYDNTHFGSFFLDHRSNLPYAAPKLYLVKADTLGNFLWAFTGGSGVSINSRVTADTEGNVFVSGSFGDSIQVFNKSAKTGGYNDFFLARINDYRITRGAVYSGPYCAGDSISIPYVKFGNYDTSNFFYAELSDEEGNFDGNHRELGRLKSDTDGVITGTLPLFEVASSGAYRIRVRSTHPQVQSFYKKDTLRLLVYSRDSAKAGPDLMICRGDTIQLSTFGGTKWQWSPPGVQNDSSHRKVKVSPLLDTEYRISISDSSGCGVTDTDYVMVRVRKPLQVIPRSDTTVCKGQAVKLFANGSGGDSLNYHFTWDHGIGLSDTAVIFPDTTATYRIILTDSCTVFNDTGYVTITVRPALSVTARTDTTICKGQALQLFASGSGGDSTAYHFSWDKGIGAGSNHIVAPDISTTYKVTLSDKCMPQNAFAFVNITVRNPLIITPRKDTTICIGQVANLFAFASGGDSTNHNFDWNSGAGNGNNISVYPDTTTTYRVILTDNCTSDPDTGFATLFVRAPVNVSLNPDSTICRGQAMHLSAIVSGGDSSYSFQWDNGDTVTQRTVTPDSTTTYLLVTSDNCGIKSDSSFVTVNVRKDIKVIERTDTTICDGQSVLLFASAEGGDSSAYFFTWDQNLNDTNYVKISPLQSTTYRVIAGDNCSPEPDTAYVEILVRQPLNIIPRSDTTICMGQEILLFANATGGDSTAYDFTWGQNIGDTNYVKATPPQTTTYMFIVSDNCSAHPDTGFVNISVRKPLKATPMRDTTICTGGKIPIYANGSGGDPANYKFTWDQGLGDTNHITVAPLLTTNYRVILSDNCTLKPDTGFLKLTVEPLPQPGFTATVTEGCEPLSVAFKNTSMSPTGSVYSWKTGDGSAAASFELLHQYLKSGLYTVVMTATSPTGCTDSIVKPALIRVNPLPKTNFKPDPRLALIGSPAIRFYNLTPQAVSYNWVWGDGTSYTTGDKDPVTHIYPDTGYYYVTMEATNIYSCSSTKKDTVRIEEEYRFHIPNSFTPNDDGLNDVFAPTTLFTVSYDLSIYNRWGVKIFSSGGKPWNGKSISGEEMPEGVYLYSFRSLDGSGNAHYTSGTVTLLR